ncbi:MAG: FAD-dependent oxidoreductase [Verrucomicrobiota bacterium JB022]|nr:FAD-dependent oxidoreductase [Verrucomicrobiota bacterium JB022]
MNRTLSSLYDVVVYGSCGAGFAAAVQAGRDGLKVLLIEPGPRIGGMTTNGLGATDIGSPRAIGGMAREFYERIFEHYEAPGSWWFESREEYLPKHPLSVKDDDRMHFFFEPSVALAMVTQMLEEAGVEVITGVGLDRTASLQFEGSAIRAIPLKGGTVVSGRFFVDASYEGDLMAMADVPYIVGREGNQQFGESLNGFRPQPVEDTAHVDPFRVIGNPSSGLLPGIEEAPDLSAGQGDSRVQAYNFRLCLTDVRDNFVAIEPPADFDPAGHEVVIRHLLAKGDCATFPFFKRTPMPNRKTDSNNHGAFSTDFVGGSHAWAEATDEERCALWQQHKDYMLGLLWSLGHDPRIPEAQRAEVRRWGLARDEFAETDNWPPQLYVREARRMVGDYVVSENDCRGTSFAPDSVALGSYAMDSHQVSRFVDQEGRLRMEGGFWKSCQPYAISYRAIIPPKGSCPNLAVPVCLSATHAAYGSIRMEPVFIMLGQAAAAAILLALEESAALQDLDYMRLRARLEDLGAMLNAPQVSLK